MGDAAVTTPRAGTLLHTTTSLCATCKRAVPAEVRRGPWSSASHPSLSDAAVMFKCCPEHGEQRALLADSARWYEETRSIAPVFSPPRARTPVSHGCPFDCGPCEQHAQRARLPVVTITSACNLDCPICYVHNKNDGAYHMTRAEFAAVVDHLLDDQGELDVLNLTGGDPTLHPDLLWMIEHATSRGIHRVTLCTNGIRLANDEGFVEQLARLGARVALSFDTFDPHTDVLLQGVPLLDKKLRCLELCERHGVDVTLIPVMTKGRNDKEIGAILRKALALRCVRHVEVHLLTYTGQGGVSFDPERSGRITMREVLADIDETTGGMLRPDDFVPSPHAHPLCYQIAYLLLDPLGELPPVSFARVVGKSDLYDVLAERLYLEPTKRLERALQDGIDRLWVAGDDDEAARSALLVLRRVLDALFSPSSTSPTSSTSGLRASEQLAKAVYVHHHMDEETFDVERVAQCCDSNCTPDGHSVPVCAYNVLYREKDPRFMQQARTWGERRGRTDAVTVPARAARGRSLPVVP